LVACHRRHPRATTASGACASLLDSRWFCCPSSRGVLLPCAHTRLHSPSCTFNNPPPPPRTTRGPPAAPPHPRTHLPHVLLHVLHAHDVVGRPLPPLRHQAGSLRDEVVHRKALPLLPAGRQRGVGGAAPVGGEAGAWRRR
jgi:hypothetical protein